MRTSSLLFVLAVLVSLIACVNAADLFRGQKPTANHAACMTECRASVPDSSLRQCADFCRPHGGLFGGNRIPRKPRLGPNHGRNATATPLADSEQDYSSKVDPGKLWDQYRSLLFSFLRKGDSNSMPYLQLVTQPIQAEWDTNPAQLNELANRLTRSGVSYEWNGKYFADEYRDFLYNIKAPASQANPALEARLADWDQKLADAEAGIMQAQMTCAMNYQKWVEMFKDSAPAFDKYQASYCNFQLKRANDKYDLILADAELDASASYGAFFDAKRALAKYAKTPNKDFVALGNLASFTASSAAGTTNKFNVKITSKTSVSREKESSWNVGISATFPVFGVPVTLGVNYASGKLDIKTSMDEFQIEVGAGGITYIPVLPNNNWFSLEAITKYQNGPFSNPRSYFNDKSMQYLVRGFYVISRPKITLYVGHEDAQQMQKTSELGAKVSVMGIGVDFGKKDRLNTKKESANTYRVEVDGNDPTPQLLAVDYLKLPL